MQGHLGTRCVNLRHSEWMSNGGGLTESSLQGGGQEE